MRLFETEYIQQVNDVELTIMYGQLIRTSYKEDTEFTFKLNKERMEEEMVERFCQANEKLYREAMNQDN